MTFDPAALADFEALFARVSPTIRAFSGCHSVELLRDARYPNILATLSMWTDEAALESYRESAFFKATWAETRAWFVAPPNAVTYLSPDSEVARSSA